MDELDEKVLDVSQRMKRAQIMRRNQAKIERARELSKKRIAPEKNIKKRAYAAARQIVRTRVAGKHGAEYEKLGPSEKIAIDRAIEGKQKLIKKLALRLIPRIKQAEAKRLQSYMKGQSLQNHGAKEGKAPPVTESINERFQEAFAYNDGGQAKQSPADNSNIDVKKAKAKANKKNSPIIQYSKFEEERDCDSSAYRAIAKKASKSGIDENILGTVYDRGMEAWSEDTGVSQQQYAFARVNSYINQGKSYFNEDADLHEGRAPGTPSIKRYTRNDGTTALKSLNKWGKRKDWRDTEGGLAKAKEHAGVDKITESMGNIYIKKSEASHQTDTTIWPDSDRPQKLQTLYHRTEGEVKNHIKSLKKKYGASNVDIKVTKLKEEVQKHHSWEVTIQHGPAGHDNKKIKVKAPDAETAQNKAEIHFKKKYPGLPRGRAEDYRKLEEVQQTNESWINSPIKWKEAVQAKHGDVTFKRKNQPGVLNKSDTHATNSDGKVVGVYQHHNKMGRVYEEVQQTNENFMDGKGPGKPGDSARHGLKGKSASELRKIRSSETASPRKKQLAHWLLNMHHNEETELDEKRGLWDNIHAKRKRIKAGSGERMRKPGSKGAPTAQDFKDAQEAFVNEEERIDPKIKVEGTNCRNCVYWRKDLEKPVTKEELNPNGGLKAPNKEYIAMSKRIDLGTLPGKDSDVKVKGFCDHDMIKDWVTERMCCSQWDSDGMIRDYKGQSPVMEADGESILPQTTSKGSKIRKKIEVVDRKPPHTEYTRQAEIKHKIIDEEGNSQNDPKKRLQGTDSLVKAYKKDTPGQSLDESFNIAFASGVGVTLTAADLGMRAQGGFAYHPSVIQQMHEQEVEEEVRSADVKGVVVKTSTGKTVVRKQKVDRKIIGSGNLTDGKPDDTL